MSSSVHIDNKNKNTLILAEEPTPWLDDITLKAEANYRINFTQPNRRFVLSLHYNGRNSFLFVNAKKIFKAKDSEIKDYMQCLGSKDFTINNMKKTGLKGTVKAFSVDYNAIGTNDIWDIHKYLMRSNKI